MSEEIKKSFGQAIDEIVNALRSIDPKSRLIAVKAACDVLEIDLASAGANSHSVQNPPSLSQPPSLEFNLNQSLQGITDIRSLKERKQPSNAQEMACLVAYYLEELAPTESRKNDIGADDLDKYFKQADFPLPKKMLQVLVDAKASGYFDSTGRGKYKLNPVGYNLVAHGLPRKPATK
jgi:hypothetical protein